MCKFLLTGFMQTICKYFYENLCNPFFQKGKKNQNLTTVTESGSTQIFSLLQDKVVIQAVCIKARFKA